MYAQAIQSSGVSVWSSITGIHWSQRDVLMIISTEAERVESEDKMRFVTVIASMGSRARLSMRTDGFVRKTNGICLTTWSYDVCRARLFILGLGVMNPSHPPNIPMMANKQRIQFCSRRDGLLF
jgi:hypothetical protein